MDRIFLYVFAGPRGGWKYVGITAKPNGRERTLCYGGLRGSLRVLAVTDLATAKLYEKRLIERLHATGRRILNKRGTGGEYSTPVKNSNDEWRPRPYSAEADRGHGARKGQHNRWHARRGIVNPKCPLCMASDK